MQKFTFTPALEFGVFEELLFQNPQPGREGLSIPCFKVTHLWDWRGLGPGCSPYPVHTSCETQGQELLPASASPALTHSPLHLQPQPTYPFLETHKNSGSSLEFLKLIF